MTRASGNSFAISSSTFCVPVPKKRICSLLHSGQISGTFLHGHNNDISNVHLHGDTLSEISQFGHSTTVPQSLQRTNEEKPRLLRNKMICSPASNRLRIASASGNENIERFP